MNNSITQILQGKSNLSLEDISKLNSQLGNYQNASLEDLYLEAALSTNDVKSKHGMKLPTKNRLIEMGKEWFAKQVPEVKKVVCTNLVVQNIIKHGEAIDNIHICILIVDLIKETFTMVHAPLIATLIVKKGLHGFCSTTIKHE